MTVTSHKISGGQTDWILKPGLFSSHFMSHNITVSYNSQVEQKIIFDKFLAMPTAISHLTKSTQEELYPCWSCIRGRRQ